ncbi:MAG: phosphatase PAP2 family protein [Armatimonadota bacterium]
MTDAAGGPRLCTHRPRRTVLYLSLVALALAVIGLCIVFVDTPLAQGMPDPPDHPVFGYLQALAYVIGNCEAGPLLVAAAAVAAGLWWRRFLLTVVVAYLMRTVGVEGLKWLTGRPRPRQMDGISAFYGPSEHYHSFPSGHAAFAFMFATILAAWFPRWRWLWYALAAYVAAIRVIVDAHFASDVIMGGLVGVLTASLALHWWPPRGGTRADAAGASDAELQARSVRRRA